jgi:hypothetical protein
LADARPSYPELPAIGVAAEALRAALKRASREYDETGAYTNGHEICWAMGGFVAQFRRVPAFWEELERRAGPVEGPGAEPHAGTEADGCRYLVHAYEAVYGHVPDGRRGAVARAKAPVTADRLGRGVLEQIGRAAEGLVEWSSKLASSRGEDRGKSRTRDARLWYFTEDPPPESEFEFGTLEGTLKELARWLHLDRRVLKDENGNRWWIRKIHGKRWRIWFPNQQACVRAKARREAESGGT